MILDRYVARRFLSAYGLSLLAFAMLFLVIDFFGRLDDFLDASESLSEQGRSIWPLVGWFYVTELPKIFGMVAPFLALFATISTVMGFARTNELNAMIGCGRNVHRVLLPVYVICGFLAILHVVMLERISPIAVKRHDDIERVIKGGGAGVEDRLGHLRDGVNVFYVHRWNPIEHELRHVEAKGFVDPSGALGVGTLSVETLSYRRHEGQIGWYPVGGRLVPSAPDEHGRPQPIIELPLTTPVPLALTPEEIGLRRKAEPAAFFRYELEALIERFPEQRARLSLEMYSRTARPLSGLVLVLLGLPLVTAGGHRSIAAGLGVALGVCVAYVALELFCLELGSQGHLQPLVAAWMAPAFYGSIAIARINFVPT